MPSIFRDCSDRPSSRTARPSTPRPRRRSRRRSGRVRTGTSAGAVEYSGLVTGGDDATEGGEWRADQVRTAHHLFRTVGMDAIHHGGGDVEGVGEHPAGDREAALNAVEEEAPRLAFALHRFEQHGLEFAAAVPFRHVHEHVRLACHGSKARVLAAMAVRLWKPLDGHSPHEEAREDAVLDHRHPACLHRLPHHPAEGLPLAHALLPMSLKPMPQDFVEEDAARPPRKDGGTGVGFDEGGSTQRVEFRHHAVHRRHHLLVRRQVAGAQGKELFGAGQHHAVVGSGRGGYGDAVEGVGGADG